MAEFNPSGSDADPKPVMPSNGSRGVASANGGVTHSTASTSHGMHAPSPYPPDAGTDGLISILSRQWHVLVLTIIGALVLSVLYLMVVKPSYTSKAVLLVIPLDPQSIVANNAGNNNQQLDSDFLDTECVVIKSNAVLALAMDQIRATRTLAGVTHPMDYVKTKLNAEPAKTGKEIEVSFDSKYSDDATLIVSSVVDAYKEYQTNAWKTRADDYLRTLQNGTLSQDRDLQEHEQRMRDIEKKIGVIPDIDPSKSPQHEEVLSLRDASEKAKSEARIAHIAYEQAAKAIIGDPEKVKAVDEAEEKSRYSTDPEDQLKKYQQELSLEQAKLVDDSRSYGPHHPTVIADQSRVDQMIVATVVAAKEWEESAAAQLEAIEVSKTEAEKAEFAASESQREYMRLQKEVDNLKKNTEDVDNRIAQIDLTKGAGALNISILNPAEPTGDVKPAKPKTLAIGLVLGIIAGVGLACARDWTDDRMRTPQAIRAAVGVPVLGAIPTINTAYTAADRGQIVHHDPFGDAAESYRTLRTALQFGMPAGTKTLLVTSPVAGDGKSTFVSNLGIAMAQASRRVLIIDADLRAPMQHRIFGLKDRTGLASVLGGLDTAEQAIQRTEIDGLDVLPCGPSPSNPAEMLNSPIFAEQLNELADKYDLIILDSPPVTAVADARILAASVDISVMVIRLESSTRKQAEVARDGLRSVGARLIGIAVNGVPKNGHFGSASGYYPHGDPAVNLTPRPGNRSFADAADSNL